MISLKFFISQDHEDNYYMIPAQNRQDWNDWLGLEYPDELPEFAETVGDDPAWMEFENPQRYNG